MLHVPKTHDKDIERSQEIWEERRILQQERETEYAKAIHECKNRVQKTQRGPMLEQLSDQVRGWLYEYKEQTGKIPEYTGSERSASRMIFSRQGNPSNNCSFPLYGHISFLNRN